MSEADAFIADLDALIEERGETIRLQRLTTGPEGEQSVFEAKVKANVRAASPSDLIEAGARSTIIVLSPTALAASRFPGLPRKDDPVYVQGDRMNIEEVAPVYVGDTLVRVKLACRG